MKKLLCTLILTPITFFAFSQSTMILKAQANHDSQIRLESNEGGEKFDFRVNNDGILRILANGNSSHEVMQIDDGSRNIGIGASAISIARLRSMEDNPSDGPTFGIDGTAQGTGSGSRYGVIGTASGTSGNRYGVYGIVSAGTGHWGVYCAGDFYYTGSFTSTSDGRLKSNIQDIDQVLSIVMSLKPRKYHFNQNVKGLTLAKGPQMGFVAQELEKVLPDLVETNLHDLIDQQIDGHHDKMEIKSINYIVLARKFPTA